MGEAKRINSQLIVWAKARVVAGSLGSRPEGGGNSVSCGFSRVAKCSIHERALAPKLKADMLFELLIFLLKRIFSVMAFLVLDVIPYPLQISQID